MVGFVVFVILSGIAEGGVPCPPTSTVEAAGDGHCTPDAAVCPGGDFDVITLTIIVRDCFAVPMPGMMVTVSPVPVGGSPYICPGEESKTVGPTDANGWTEVQFPEFGGCGTIQFSAEVSSVEIGPSNPVFVITPDYSGDGLVNLIDFGWFATRYLTADPCFDYNCDGIVDLKDFGQFASHFLDWC
jgi:hypothetical protein